MNDSWFRFSVHPAFRKAKDELPRVPDQPIRQRMIATFPPGLPVDLSSPPNPVEVGNHVIEQLKARGMPHDPGLIRRTVNHLIKNVDHPDLVFHPEKGSVIAAQDNTGWKLRLNTGRDLGSEPDELDHHIMKFLASQGYGGYAHMGGTKENPLKIPRAPGVERMGSFKRGSGGEQWPEQGIYQNYTIYTGGRKPTQALAEKLERNFGAYLKTGMEGTEAMLTPHVGARFVYDNGPKGVNNMNDSLSPEFHTGETTRGVPLPVGYHPWFRDPTISRDDAVRSHDLLWSILSPEYYGPPLHQ